MHVLCTCTVKLNYGYSNMSYLSLLVFSIFHLITYMSNQPVNKLDLTCGKLVATQHKLVPPIGPKNVWVLLSLAFAALVSLTCFVQLESVYPFPI